MKPYNPKSSPLLKDDAFAVVLAAVFLVVGALGATHHEMWRDEVHSWLLARDSPSVWALFQASRYEGHFVLWRILLYGITRFTHNPLALQFFNLFLATATAWIIARFSPFRRYEKCLLCFGYYFSYEYCIIAQDYTMIVLLMIAFCALYPRRTKSHLGLSIILFLLANTLPYGLLVVLVFAALLAFDRVFHPQRPGVPTPASHGLRASLVIFLLGVATAILQLLLIQHVPNTVWQHRLTLPEFSQTIINIWRAYTPIPSGFPDLGRWFWGSNLVDVVVPWPWVKAGLSLGVGLLFAGLLFSRPPALFLYVVGTSALLAAQFLVSVGALRHSAFLFLMFVCSLWIWSESADWQWPREPMRRLGASFASMRTGVVLTLLVIHCVAGAYAFSADWVYPFSGGKQAAGILRYNGLCHSPIIASPESKVIPISAYLDQAIYYPESSRFGTYADYSRDLKTADLQQILKKAFELSRQTHGDIAVVLASYLIEVNRQGVSVPLPSTRITSSGGLVSESETHGLPSATIQLMHYCPAQIDEDYFIYVVRAN